MHSNRTILHVDDDPEILRVVATILRSKGDEVLSLSDPQQIIPVLADSGARLVLLDIDLPDSSGLEILKSIKSYDGGIQVVMLTGVVDMSTVLRSMRWGAEACVLKPITDREPLLQAIDAAWDKVHRWWQCLEELKVRKQNSQQPVAPAAK